MVIFMIHRTSKVIKTAALSAAALLALSACGGDDDSAEGEVITVGIAGEVPYSYLNDDGDPEGATVALAERIFGDMGYEVDAELVDWDNLIPGLNAERYGAISYGMPITTDHLREVACAAP